MRVEIRWQLEGASSLLLSCRPRDQTLVIKLTTNAILSAIKFFLWKKNSICIGALMKIVIFSFKIISITKKKILKKKISKFQICQAYVNVPLNKSTALLWLYYGPNKKMSNYFKHQTLMKTLRPKTENKCKACWSHRGSCCWLTYTDFSVSHSFKVS